MTRKSWILAALLLFLSTQVRAQYTDISGDSTINRCEQKTYVVTVFNDSPDTFTDLVVSDEGFAITLNFGDNPEPMYIPYDAIKTFVDPSVEFGLRFETQDSDEDGVEDFQTDDEPDSDFVEIEEIAHHDAEIVSLDSFRK